MFLPKQFGENEIQVWKHNPKMLSTEGVVDKLSLYLSLKDNEDERIQIELSVFYVLRFLVFVWVLVLG